MSEVPSRTSSFPLLPFHYFLSTTSYFLSTTSYFLMNIYSISLLVTEKMQTIASTHFVFFSLMPDSLFNVLFNFLQDLSSNTIPTDERRSAKNKGGIFGQQIYCLSKFGLFVGLSWSLSISVCLKKQMRT